MSLIQLGIEGDTMREKLRQLRKEKALSQAEMANILNVHQTAVSQWEQGRTTPDMQTLIKIADYFQVTVDYLLGQKNGVDDHSYKALTNIENELIKKYRLLDQHGQKAVNSVLDVEFERCSKASSPSNLVEIPYVARSGERGTVTKTQEEIDEILKNLKPDTSGRF